LGIRTTLVSVATLPDAEWGTPQSGVASGSAIRVTISDTGVGIPSDRLSRIFDPFYTTKEKGLGLGMAIAHRIIEDHKGSINVESQVGLGAAFTVHLAVAL